MDLQTIAFRIRTNNKPNKTRIIIIHGEQLNQIGITTMASNKIKSNHNNRINMEVEDGPRAINSSNLNKEGKITTTKCNKRT